MWPSITDNGQLLSQSASKSPLPHVEPEFHQEVQQHAERYDSDDDQAADMLSECERYAAGDDKNDDEGISEEAQKTDQRSEARLPHQGVWDIRDRSKRRRSAREPSLVAIVSSTVVGSIPQSSTRRFAPSSCF